MLDFEILQEKVQSKEKFGYISWILPIDLIEEILQWRKLVIRPEHALFPLNDYRNHFGKSFKPHITIKYGIRENDNQLVWKEIYNCISPTNIILKDIKIFKQPDYDVLYFSIEDKFLTKTYNQLSRRLDSIDFNETYNPHLTIAYLKKDCGENYLTIPNRFKGRKVFLNTVEYQDKHGKYKIRTLDPNFYKPDLSHTDKYLTEEENSQKIDSILSQINRKEDILKIKENDVDLKLIKKLFAHSVDKLPICQPSDSLVIPKGHYILKNEESIKTTVGRYLYNTFIYGETLLPITGYVNEPMTKSKIQAIEKKITNALIEDRVNTEEFIRYIDKIQWLGFSTSPFMTSSLSYDLIIPLPEVIKRRDELFEQYKDEIAAGDPLVSGKIEKELLDLSKKLLQNTPGMDLYTSESRSKFGNHYKNIAIMRGTIGNPGDPNEFHISKSNLVEGIPFDEYDKYANIMVQASYSRSTETEKGKQTCPCKISLIAGNSLEPNKLQSNLQR